MSWFEFIWIRKGEHFYYKVLVWWERTHHLFKLNRDHLFHYLSNRPIKTFPSFLGLIQKAPASTFGSWNKRVSASSRPTFQYQQWQISQIKFASGDSRRIEEWNWIAYQDWKIPNLREKNLRLKNPITGWRFYSQASGKLTEMTVFVNKKLRLINPSFDVS